jgi:hypothetical protein
MNPPFIANAKFKHYLRLRADRILKPFDRLYFPVYFERGKRSIGSTDSELQ